MTTLVMPRVAESVLTQVPTKSAGAAVAGSAAIVVARAARTRVCFSIFRVSSVWISLMF